MYQPIPLGVALVFLSLNIIITIYSIVKQCRKRDGLSGILNSLLISQGGSLLLTIYFIQSVWFNFRVAKSEITTIVILLYSGMYLNTFSVVQFVNTILLKHTPCREASVPFSKSCHPLFIQNYYKKFHIINGSLFFVLYGLESAFQLLGMIEARTVVTIIMNIDIVYNSILSIIGTVRIKRNQGLKIQSRLANLQVTVTSLNTGVVIFIDVFYVIALALTRSNIMSSDAFTFLLALEAAFFAIADTAISIILFKICDIVDKTVLRMERMAGMPSLADAVPQLIAM